MKFYRSGSSRPEQALGVLERAPRAGGEEVVFDTHHALNDMAQQIRRCRAQDGWTLQQLATRSGVAASTIHKVEAGQMVPTLSVLLKIARGLDRRPEELVRDEATREAGGGAWGTDESAAEASPNHGGEASPNHGGEPSPNHDREASPGGGVGVWRIDLAPAQSLPNLVLDPRQRAIVWVEKGALRLRSGERRLDLDAGDCIEIGGDLLIQSPDTQLDPASVTLFISPPGNLDRDLGAPSGPARPEPAGDSFLRRRESGRLSQPGPI